MKAEKHLKERGEKSLKPDDYRRIGRESVALLLKEEGSVLLYVSKNGPGSFY